MKKYATVLFLLLALVQAALTSSAEEEEAINRQVRQANAEEMVDNILQWLQGVYTKRNRKARQGNYQYLPPGGTNAERPRPFQPASSTQRPQRPSSSSTPYQPAYEGSSSFSPANPPYPPSSQNYPDYSQSGYPATGASPSPPFVSPGYNPPSSSPSYNTPGTSYLPGRPSTLKPIQPGVGPSDNFVPVEPNNGYQPIPSNPPSFSTPGGYQPSSPGGGYQPSTPGGYQPSTPGSYQPSTPGGYQPSTPGSFQPSTPGYQSSTPGYKPSSPGYQSSTPGFSSTTPGYRPSSTPGYVSSTTPRPFPDDDDNHPPHIHAIDVECAKDMMTINLEFNKVYNGIIYSKGYFNDPNCRYVQENSNRIKYSFTLSLNSCGTEFINGFETQGQSYLENVLVFQNEAGIQEVWDSIRSVRCLWEGNLNKQLSIALSVGMLNQEVVTFSGDTAMASLDIQLGRGPFAQPANGLVKIGEVMTLVVSITGDPGFDVQVRDCKARDSTSTNVIALTDDQGCILKPKVFGAFQKTRNTGNTGSSIIAYAFFNAFKFPDVMDLILECNVELCKVNCEMCPNPNQKLEPGRRRRRDVGNETLSDPVIVGKQLRVILPEDLAVAEPLGVCLSYAGFLFGAAFILAVMAISCVCAGCMWLKLQRHSHCKNHS